MHRSILTHMICVVAFGMALFLVAGCSSDAVPPEQVSTSSDVSDGRSRGEGSGSVTSHGATAAPTSVPATGAFRVAWSEIQFDGRIADVYADGERFVHVVLAGTQPDPADPFGRRHVVLVGSVEP